MPTANRCIHFGHHGSAKEANASSYPGKIQAKCSKSCMMSKYSQNAAAARLRKVGTRQIGCLRKGRRPSTTRSSCSKSKLIRCGEKDCTEDLQSTERTIAVAEDLNADLEAKIGPLKARPHHAREEEGSLRWTARVAERSLGSLES